MRIPTNYEHFLLKASGKMDKEPLWVVNEIRAFYWMFNLYRRMCTNWNGYNITKYTRFQIEHAPDSRFRKQQELSRDMISMLDSFCEILLELQDNILSYYPAGKTVNLMKQDRDLWDEACDKIREILNRKPDPEREKEIDSWPERKPLPRMKELLLIAKDQNWGLVGPGDEEEAEWKVYDDSSYVLKVTYRPDILDQPQSDKIRKGQLSKKDYDLLFRALIEPWSDEKTDACDGEAWEFTLYYPEHTILNHRPMGYIYGIEPYESIVRILRKYRPDIDN